MSWWQMPEEREMDAVAKCQVKNSKEKTASDAWQLASEMDTGDSCDSGQSPRTACVNWRMREGGSHDF